jgi:hypothetical protein
MAVDSTRLLLLLLLQSDRLTAAVGNNSCSLRGCCQALPALLGLLFGSLTSCCSGSLLISCTAVAVCSCRRRTEPARCVALPLSCNRCC